MFRLLSDALLHMSSQGRDDCRSTVSVAPSVGPLAVVILRLIGDGHGLTPSTILAVQNEQPERLDRLRLPVLYGTTPAADVTEKRRRYLNDYAPER